MVLALLSFSCALSHVLCKICFSQWSLWPFTTCLIALYYFSSVKVASNWIHSCRGTQMYGAMRRSQKTNRVLRPHYWVREQRLDSIGWGNRDLILLGMSILKCPQIGRVALSITWMFCIRLCVHFAAAPKQSRKSRAVWGPKFEGALSEGEWPFCFFRL